MLDGFIPAPMFPGRDGGPRGPGWFMNWLLYGWFGPIWKDELICKKIRKYLRHMQAMG